MSTSQGDSIGDTARGAECSVEVLTSRAAAFPDVPGITEDERLFRDFMRSGLSLHDYLLRITDLEARDIIYEVSQRFLWEKKQAEYTGGVYTQAQGEYKQFIAKMRPSVLSSQMNLTNKLSEKLTEAIDALDIGDKLTESNVRQLELLTRSVKCISDVQSRLVAISDRPFDIEEMTKNGGPKFILLNAGPKSQKSASEALPG